MITIKSPKVEGMENYHDLSVTIDFGTSVVSASYGIVHAHDLENLLIELQADVAKLLARLA